MDFKNKKVALLFICLNPPYWPYVKDAIQDCRKYFLTNHEDNHQVDFFLWTDLPEGVTYGATVFPTEPIEWPMPTLMRYHLFMQQEEVLKDYDYIFYLDADMRVVDFIDNEILTDGLTAALHPMYALRHHYNAPLEPNPESTAFIKRPTQYFAGGFQGGVAKAFIEAMRVMRGNIDKDFMNNYMARWNDESHWNRYLFDHPPKVVLSPAYIYPDSLIKEYYEPLWGCSYKPKIITLTKPFTTSKAGGIAVQQMIGNDSIQVENTITCPTCGDSLTHPGHVLGNILACDGGGKPHKLETKKI